MARASLTALLVAEVVSVTGNHATRLALPWFVLETTTSASQMSAVLATQMASMALCGIPAGTFAARFPPRRVMQVSDLAQGMLIGLVPVLHGAGMLSFPALLVVVFLVGSFFAPYHAAQRVLLPSLVGNDQRALTRANTLLVGAARSAALLGPAVAAVLIAEVGAAQVLVLDAVSFVAASLLVTLSVRDGNPAAPGPARVFAGVVLTVRDRVLRPWTAGQCACEMAVQIVLAAIPVMAFLRYGGDARTAGALLMTFGGGAVAGNVVVLALLRRFTGARLIVAGCVLEPVALWVLAVDTRLVTLGVVLLLAGVFLGLMNGPGAAMQIERMPPHLRAQGMSAFVTVVLAAGAVGLAISGPVAETLAPRAVFAIVAALYTAGSLLTVVATTRAA
ncbi:MFS transporter [Sphaerisporangium aureirubrum]|uniref:MFS transporter n=1 Tax=Sphaerisporangium aureirubrum TaxID=1544736 RepID=A0ABW1NMS4_9ACTN